MIKMILKKISRLINKIERKSYDNFFNCKKKSGIPLYIEFVGVSGVGKTTLFNYFKKKTNINWIDISCFVYRNNNKFINFDKFENHQLLAHNKLLKVSQEDHLPFDKLQLLNFFYSVLRDDILVKELNVNETVISEEGLIHNFGDNILNMENIKTFDLDSLLSKRAFVYCYSTPEKVAKQILLRKDITGKLLPQHKNLTESMLVSAQRLALQEKSLLINYLQKRNVPVILIDTGNDLNENFREISNFILKLQSNYQNLKVNV